MRTRNSLGHFVGFILVLLVTSGASRGQDPLAAGRSSVIDASFGYAYLQTKVPSSGQVGMSGVDGTLTAGLFPRIGVTTDFCYARSGEIFDSHRSNDLMSYLGGPVRYVVQARRTNVYVHALLGGYR